jgi:hypothetical protein
VSSDLGAEVANKMCRQIKAFYNTIRSEVQCSAVAAGNSYTLTGQVKRLLLCLPLCVSVELGLTP